MEQRTRFALDYTDGLFTMSELCARYHISRKTGYKWIHRYEAEGLTGLGDRSHRAHTCPHKTPEHIEQLLVACRTKHPYWGPRKLREYLSRRHRKIRFPAESTIGAILDRNGLLRRRRKRRSSRHPGAVPLTTTAPNQIWGADYKGQFKMLNGIYNFPLTITDAHSRFILSCTGLPSVEQRTAIPEFERLFRTYGLPDAIRTDNGGPFATRALCGLSRLSVYWIKLGIMHQRITPGCPQQNGRHERMHKDLKQQTARPPKRNFKQQQRRFDAFRDEFNHERPHEALEGETPASVYTSSSRALPTVVPEPDYPAHYEVRFVSSAGIFKWKKHQIFISQTLGKEWIAFEEIDDGIWSIYFYDVLLARLNERDFKLKAAVS